MWTFGKDDFFIITWENAQYLCARQKYPKINGHVEVVM